MRRELTMCSLYTITVCHPLQMETKGDLLISLKYNTVEKTLEGVLLKATNLQKQGRVLPGITWVYSAAGEVITHGEAH